ncbi:hypothetical protein ZWY2020_038591 [Hordeum vulgare]|nr:hypothetical protein ZWY2020_038591 [Hordeum vulgare]
MQDGADMEAEERMDDLADEITYTMVKAVVVITGSEGVKGTIFFTQEGDGPTTMTGSVTGLKEGLYGFHAHSLGDTTNGCMSTGPHFNPAGHVHGAPEDKIRHAGDLGNVTAGADGVANINVTDCHIPLAGPHSIIGRAVVVHGDADDLGKGWHTCFICKQPSSYQCFCCPDVSVCVSCLTKAQFASLTETKGFRINCLRKDNGHNREE